MWFYKTNNQQIFEYWKTKNNVKKNGNITYEDWIVSFKSLINKKKNSIVQMNRRVHNALHCEVC